LPAASRFLLGLHYWPRTKGLEFWKAFDAEEIGKDFARIRALGAQAVSLPLIWEDFQTRPDLVSDVALRQLDAVFDLAAANRLKVLPVLFSGHQCGVNWLPWWTLRDEQDDADPLPRRVSIGMRVRRRVRDLLADPAMLRAQVNLLREVVPRYRDHPALWGWCVGSELGRVVEPTNREAMWLWNALIGGEVKRLDPRHPALYTVGAEDLLRDRIRPDDMSAPEDMVGLRVRDMGPDPQEVLFVANLAGHLAARRVLAMDLGRPMVSRGAESRFEDYHEGQTHRTAYLVSEEQAAEYLGETLSGLWEGGAAGAFVYCYSDVAADVCERPPFDERLPERSFGLLRADGSEKPAAAAFRAFARQRRPLRAAATNSVLADLSPEAYYEAPDEHFRIRLAEFAD